jgi:hypothetical protein
MARDFAGAHSQTSTLSAYPITMAVAAQPDVATTSRYACSLADSATSADEYILLGGWSNNPRCLVSQGGTARIASETGDTFSDGVPKRIVGVVYVDTNIYVEIYTEGNRSGVSNNYATPTTFPSIDRWVVGVEGDSSPGFWWQGALQDACLWNVQLSADEINAFLDGVAPELIRPGAIVHSLSMRTPALVGHGGSYSNLGGGSSVFPHFYETKYRSSAQTGLAIPAAGVPPLAMHHYRRRRAG